MPKITGDVELYMGPKEVGGKDDLCQTIVTFIDGAKKKLDIAVQELDCKPIADAIIRAKKRKVTVRLVLEASYLTLDKPRHDPYIPGGKNETNRLLHDAILRSAIWKPSRVLQKTPRKKWQNMHRMKLTVSLMISVLKCNSHQEKYSGVFVEEVIFSS